MALIVHIKFTIFFCEFDNRCCTCAIAIGEDTLFGAGISCSLYGCKVLICSNILEAIVTCCRSHKRNVGGKCLQSSIAISISRCHRRCDSSTYTSNSGGSLFICNNACIGCVILTNFCAEGVVLHVVVEGKEHILISRSHDGRTCIIVNGTPFADATSTQITCATRNVLVVEIDIGVLFHAHAEATCIIINNPVSIIEVFAGHELNIVIGTIWSTITSSHDTGIGKEIVSSLCLIDNLEACIGFTDERPRSIGVKGFAGILKCHFTCSFAIINKVLATDIQVVIIGIWIICRVFHKRFCLWSSDELNISVAAGADGYIYSIVGVEVCQLIGGRQSGNVLAIACRYGIRSKENIVAAVLHDVSHRVVGMEVVLDCLKSFCGIKSSCFNNCTTVAIVSETIIVRDDSRVIAIGNTCLVRTIESDNCWVVCTVLACKQCNFITRTFGQSGIVTWLRDKLLGTDTIQIVTSIGIILLVIVVNEGKLLLKIRG